MFDAVMLCIALETSAPIRMVDATEREIVNLKAVWQKRNPGTELVFKKTNNLSPWFTGYIDWQKVV
jgi:hypothetical protein